MENDRCIFAVIVLRMILDSLIYLEKIPLVDEHMSNSNIGVWRKQNIRDHLFIVFALMNSILNG